MWGRKKEANAAPLHPPSLYDPTIDPCDLRILCYSRFSNDPWFDLRKVFGSQYSPFINHASLRPALCALALCFKKRFLSDKVQIEGTPEKYISQAQRSLIQKQSCPTTIDEGDLFAAFLLSFTQRRLDHRFMIHCRGAISIMRHLLTAASGDYARFELGVQ